MVNALVKPMGIAPSINADRPPLPIGLRNTANALTEAIADVHRRGWCDGTSGNFSCTILKDPVELLMAPSGVPKAAVLPQDLIVIDEQARVIHGTGKASAETLLHLSVVTNTGAGAVLHTHSQAATLLSRYFGPDQFNPSSSSHHPNHQSKTIQQAHLFGKIELKDLEMLKGLKGISSHNNAVIISVLKNDQNIENLSTQATSILKDAPHGFLISGHGLYAWGKDIQEARRHLEILEFLLELRWRQLLLDLLIKN